MLYHTKTVRQTLEELGTAESGLADSEAAERLKSYGPNAIKISGEPLWRKLIEPFANVFMLVLFIAAVISLIEGAYLDASIIGVIMAISGIIYYVQRFSTERVLKALQKQQKQMVDVLREHRTVPLDTENLVPGDIILLHEGEKVPADARLISHHNLRVDESQLTGESIAVDKQLDALEESREVYERSNMVFQGSFVIAGEATAAVVATGNDTEFGRIASLTKQSAQQSPIQQKIDKLISQLITVIAAVGVVVFILSIFRGTSPAESLRFVMALTVSAVPEDLPVAISVILVLGMRRMAAKKALVRTIRSIETIGALTTIATDKTGTLTKNQLTAQAAWEPQGSSLNLAEVVNKAVNHSGQKMHDPLDTALYEYADKHHGKHSAGQPLTAIPFDQSVAMSGNLWHNGSTYELDVKGAPEQILARSDLTFSEREKAYLELNKMTGQGFRVIAIARAELKEPLDGFDQLPKKTRFEFAGLVAVADILRREAHGAIKAATGAGVTVRMITGDHFETAYHIARQLGMVTSRDQVFDSRKMNVMSDEELEAVVENIRVFSRVIPEHKYRILTILKKRHITAMTGDGVNDVPALANAHVGIAMGSGTQIAKDAGDIILLDDNFKHIIEAIAEGRTILANIRRMLFYLLSTNTGEVITMIASLVIGLPLPLVPVQILWLNLVTDTALVIPLGLEPGEKNNMKRPPHDPKAPILNRLMLTRVVIAGSVMAAVTLILYGYFNNHYGNDYARTIAFSSLVVMQWANAFSARSDYESAFRRLKTFSGKFYIGLSAAIGLQILVMFGPLGPVLHVTHVDAGHLLTTAAIAFLIELLTVDLHKFVHKNTRKSGRRRAGA